MFRHSIFLWSSPVWVVPKKLNVSGKQKCRVVINYGKLTELTVNDKYCFCFDTDINQTAFSVKSTKHSVFSNHS